MLQIRHKGSPSKFHQREDERLGNHLAVQHLFGDIGSLEEIPGKNIEERRVPFFYFIVSVHNGELYKTAR